MVTHGSHTSQLPMFSPVKAKCATVAPTVPASSPQKPPHAVVRFQNMPMMNVANSGALKIENSVWM